MATVTNTPQIPQTIQRQLGGALAMLGAYNLSYDSQNPTFLSFRIKGCRKINYIKITLTPADLYNMEFGRCLSLTGKNLASGNLYEKVSTVEGVYWDQLKPIITEKTGLYTTL